VTEVRKKRLKVTLTTGRTIEQGTSLVGTKLTAKARKATGICFMDPEDMALLEITESQHVKITTSEGTIVVVAKKSNEAPHPGIVFMPLGIYANWVLPPGDAGVGVPLYKGVEATIVPTTEKVPEVETLVKRLMQQRK